MHRGLIAGTGRFAGPSAPAGRKTENPDARPADIAITGWLSDQQTDPRIEIDILETM